MEVSAIIVTRGDVDLQPILQSLPDEWQRVVWDNGKGRCTWSAASRNRYKIFVEVTDLGVFGRYEAIQHAKHDLIFVQDDDVIIDDPQAIVDAWHKEQSYLSEWTFEEEPHEPPRDLVVCNMPPEFRHDFYADHALVGFGSCFNRDAPEKAFERFANYVWDGDEESARLPDPEVFNRTCDVIFTALTPRILVDVPKTNMDYASAPNRMWKQASHVNERSRILDLALQVRDA